MPAYRCLHGCCTDMSFLPLVHALFGCSVRPNTVTVFNTAAVLPLLLYSMYRTDVSSWFLFFPCIVLNRFLDIADGHIARQCNMKSKLGAQLDIFGDTLLVVGLFVLSCIHHQKPYMKLVLGLAVVLCAKQVVDEVWTTGDEEQRSMSDWETLYADNSMVLTVLACTLLKASFV